ncbi:outer membrane beta-barrel protein [Vibrio sp. WXL210]|uniref:outer membrane beta-barrel protein n=1 Tax=Vibrio sp. WXL210 TaxID=3450709 RepID=UPI003EC8CCAD
MDKKNVKENRVYWTKVYGAKVQLAIIGLAAMPSWAAVSPAPYTTELGIDIIPQVSTSLQYNDNVTNELRSSDQISSSVFIITPSVRAVAERGKQTYSAEYVLSSGTYFSSSEDNYLDHRIILDAEWDINIRNDLYINYEYNLSHEERGTSITEGSEPGDINFFGEPLEYSTNHIDLTYGYGADGARGRVEATVGYSDRRYQNFTELTRFRDYDQTHIEGIFYVRVRPATRVFANILREDREYKSTPTDGLDLSSDTMYYYAGAEWDVTEKTTGRVRLGLQDKQFDDSGREDFDGTSWDASVTYLPRRHSRLEFEASQRAKDPDQFGDFIEEQRYAVSWRHFWRQRFSTLAGFTYLDEEYTGVSRDDETNRWNVEATYDLRRWVSLSVGWRYNDKESTQDGIGHQQHIWYLTADVSL